ncbi:MAG TPA: winged helix-turn-helix domain-containing protein [Rhizomicrobium sp.]|jgi:DNA-binding winged helix-turn-helix (wHTH) protein
MNRRSREQKFSLGDWSVDPSRGVIVRDGTETRLEPQQMDLLLLFAGEPGVVLSKDRIIAGVWNGRAIGDDTLAAAISRLRGSLGETKENRIIETVPKRGYRLLLVPDNVASAPAETAKASGLIAQGFAALRTPMPSSLAQAQVYFEGAIAADPKSAAAHTGLADTLLMQHRMGQGRALVAAAKASAHAATALDESYAPGWSALGFATLLADRDFAAADACYQRAIACDASLAQAHRGRSFALACVGRFVDAEREARRVVELTPLTLQAHADLVQLLIAARRYVPAIAEAKRAIALSAQSSEAWSLKGWAHAFLGEEREAVEALLESLRLWGTGKDTLAGLTASHAQGGFAELLAAGADLFETQRVMFVPRAMDIAMLRAGAGQPDAAFAALDTAVAQDDPTLLLLPYLPHLDRLRNDPRFTALMERVRLVH